MSLGITDTQYYTDIADAIRAKNGEPATTKYTPAQMAAAVGQLSPPADDTKWQRPQAWPQYTDAMLTNQEVLYFTIDLTVVTPYIAVFIESTRNSNGATIQLGYIENGSFISVASVNPTSTLQLSYGGFQQFWYMVIDKAQFSGRDYICAKVTPTENTHILQYSFKKRASVIIGNTYIYEDGQQPVLEIFGRLPYATIVTSGSYDWPFSQSITRSLEIHDMAAPKTFTMGGNNSKRALENVQLINIDCTSTTSMVNFMDNIRAQYVTVDLKNTGSVTNLSYGFRNSNAMVLDLKGLDTSHVTNLSGVFAGTSIGILDVSTWDTSSVTDMTYAFQNAIIDIIDLSSWNLEYITNMSDFFGQNHAGSKIIFPDNLTHTAHGHTWTSSGDCKLVTTTNANTFRGYNVTSFQNQFFKLYVSFAVQYMYALGHDNIMNIINTLPTVSTTATITLGTTNKSLLSAEEIAIAENKGWTVA